MGIPIIKYHECTLLFTFDETIEFCFVSNVKNKK